MQTQLPKILAKRKRDMLSSLNPSKSEASARTENVKLKKKLVSKCKTTLLSNIDHNKYNRADIFKRMKISDCTSEITTSDRSLYKFYP